MTIIEMQDLLSVSLAACLLLKIDLLHQFFKQEEQMLQITQEQKFLLE